MKGFVEFMGYRSRIIYDSDIKEFVARGVGYPNFEVRDTNGSTETRFKPLSQSTTEHEGQRAELEGKGERSATLHKFRASASTHSSAMMES